MRFESLSQDLRIIITRLYTQWKTRAWVLLCSEYPTVTLLKLVISVFAADLLTPVIMHIFDSTLMWFDVTLTFDLLSENGIIDYMHEGLFPPSLKFPCRGLHVGLWARTRQTDRQTAPLRNTGCWEQQRASQQFLHFCRLLYNMITVTFVRCLVGAFTGGKIVPCRIEARLNSVNCVARCSSLLQQFARWLLVM